MAAVSVIFMVEREVISRVMIAKPGLMEIRQLLER
jgi:hypothetical protein